MNSIGLMTEKQVVLAIIGKTRSTCNHREEKLSERSLKKGLF